MVKRGFNVIMQCVSRGWNGIPSVVMQCVRDYDAGGENSPSPNHDENGPPGLGQRTLGTTKMRRTL